MAIRLRSMGPRLRIRGGTFTPIHFRKSPAALPAVGYGSGGNRFILFFFAGLLAGTAAANFPACFFKRSGGILFKSAEPPVESGKDGAAGAVWRYLQTEND